MNGNSFIVVLLAIALILAILWLLGIHVNVG